MIRAEVVCDECSTQGDPHDIREPGLIRRIRTRAKNRGWIRRKINGKMVDLCFLCKSKKELKWAPQR